ncbi:MAG: hypothetical protein D6690_13380 [Nitrospirae bacterium]|nr:MAG: hypothetical protein D6690_13380 [Nitrospirota bacterium]
MPSIAERPIDDNTCSTPSLPRATLYISHHLAQKLLELYDVPHPFQPDRIIIGYDKPHALRTAKMCGAVAKALHYASPRIEQFQIACLLHDLGRVGLDQDLFGKIWSWAKAQGIPTRPREWRDAYPDTLPGKETAAFLRRFSQSLEAAGIVMDKWAREQVEMRLGFARRLRKQLRMAQPKLLAWGIAWSPWMERIMLYYYYPEKLARCPSWVRQLAEILVACEQLEAYSNARRGRDYYTREHENLRDAFEYLIRLHHEGLISRTVLGTVYRLALHHVFDEVLAAARGSTLCAEDRHHLMAVAHRIPPCPS